MKLKQLICETAQGQTEYALILSLIAIFSIVLLTMVGGKVSDIFCNVQKAFTGEDTCSTRTVCGDDFSEDSGDWLATGGRYELQDNQMCLSNYAQVFNQCAYSELESNDYTITLDGANLEDGKGYGVYFRTENSTTGSDRQVRQNGYTFQYDPGWGGFTFEKWVNGHSAGRLASVKMPGYDYFNQPRDIKVVVQGDTYKGYVDGELVLTATDSTYTTGGIGLRTWGGSDVCFDDFGIERP